MQVDKSRLGKIGIDRIVINNFKILNFDELEKKEVNTKYEYIEKVEKRTKLYDLKFIKSLNIENEIYSISSLEINPNRIRERHNIYNSTVSEFMEELENIVKALERDGIKLDISEAKVKEIEINITLETKFSSLEEVLLLIGRANYKNALGMYSFDCKDIPREIKTERSLYLNQRFDKKENTGKVIKFYDKSFEMLRNQNMKIDEELTRVEVLCGRDYYRNQINVLGYSNSIYDLKDEILKEIFLKSLEIEVKDKPFKYLETLKKNLIYDFRNFKRNEKAKRVEREKLKKLGKQIPNIYKEQRGVFEYLKNNSWIFDYSHLIELVETEIESKHKSIYEKQIKAKYMKLANLEVFEKLLNSIFQG